MLDTWRGMWICVRSKDAQKQLAWTSSKDWQENAVKESHPWLLMRLRPPTLKLFCSQGTRGKIGKQTTYLDDQGRCWQTLHDILKIVNWKFSGSFGCFLFHVATSPRPTSPHPRVPEYWRPRPTSPHPRVLRPWVLASSCSRVLVSPSHF